jgi:transposase
MGLTIRGERSKKKRKDRGRITQRRRSMSLKAQAICPVPQETTRIARAAYPKGNLYMQMRDVLGCIYKDEDFADLFPKEGQPAQAPWRLALITVMQFIENLSDRQAADAVRGRIEI